MIAVIGIVLAIFLSFAGAALAQGGMVDGIYSCTTYGLTCVVGSDHVELPVSQDNDLETLPDDAAREGGRGEREERDQYDRYPHQPNDLVRDAKLESRKPEPDGQP